jgi:(2Fe-2S) ferredoxin/ubiquinone/menaquinone biosynthesis C-methylase UbiE
MEQAFRHHVFVCTQQQLEDKVYCKEQGGREVLQEFQRQVRKQDLDKTVEVSAAGCLGLCRRGPAMVVYPEGVWYTGISVGDVSEIVSSHLKAGKPVERLVFKDVEQLRQEIREEKARTRSEDAAHQEAGVLSEKLRRLAGDFQASRAFLSAVELDLFTAVGDGCGAAEAAEKMGTDLRATEMLLNALTSIGLLEKNDDIYTNGPETGRFLRRGLPDDARIAVMHRVNMWDGWSTLTACVREGGSLGYDINFGPSATQAYIAATHRIAALAAPAMVASLELPGLKRMLDVGGGSGAYTLALLKAFEGATAEIMDLPPVIRIATRHIREAEMEDRVTLRAGNFMVDPLGSDFDLILTSYVTHLIDPEANKRLLGKAFQALQPGGRLVINDYVLNADKTLPRAATLYGLNMLVATHGGSAYSYDEYRGWLEAVGFKNVQKVKLLGPTDVVTACKE